MNASRLPSSNPHKTFRLLGPDGTIYESTEPGLLGGYRVRKIYGRLDCPSANRHLAKGGYAKHRVFFATETSAIAAGYRPCGICMRERYKAWKAGGPPASAEYPWLVVPRSPADA